MHRALTHAYRLARRKRLQEIRLGKTVVCFVTIASNSLTVLSCVAPPMSPVPT